MNDPGERCTAGIGGIRWPESSSWEIVEKNSKIDQLLECVKTINKRIEQQDTEIKSLKVNVHSLYMFK